MPLSTACLDARWWQLIGEEAISIRSLCTQMPCLEKLGSPQPPAGSLFAASSSFLKICFHSPEPAQPGPLPSTDLPRCPKALCEQAAPPHPLCLLCLWQRWRQLQACSRVSPEWGYEPGILSSASELPCVCCSRACPLTALPLSCELPPGRLRPGAAVQPGASAEGGQWEASGKEDSTSSFVL